MFYTLLHSNIRFTYTKVISCVRIKYFIFLQEYQCILVFFDLPTLALPVAYFFFSFYILLILLVHLPDNNNNNNILCKMLYKILFIFPLSIIGCLNL